MATYSTRKIRCRKAPTFLEAFANEISHAEKCGSRVSPMVLDLLGTSGQTPEA